MKLEFTYTDSDGTKYDVEGEYFHDDNDFEPEAIFNSTALEDVDLDTIDSLLLDKIVEMGCEKGSQLEEIEGYDEEPEEEEE